MATLTVGEIKPAGTTIAGAPATVTGNTTYGFTQTVPGTAKSAAATAFLVWGDGAKSDPIGTIALGGDCTPPAPVCVAHITNNQLAAHYTTDAFHATVSYTGNKPLCDNASRVVSLNSYQAEGPTWPTSGNQAFVDHDQVTIDKTHTTGNLSVDQPSCFYQTDLYVWFHMFKIGALRNYGPMRLGRHRPGTAATGRGGPVGRPQHELCQRRRSRRGVEPEQRHRA